MNVIFQINGGIGKNIAATAVCEGIKRKYPDSKLIVVCGYPEVFVNNPHVYRAFNFNQTTYFYKEYIQGQDFVFLGHDPYLTTSHIKQDTHLIQTWFDLFGLEYKGERSNIYLTDREVNFYRSRVMSDKPLLIMQTNGGAENQALKYSWARDIPAKVVMSVIEEFANTHNILHIRRDDQPQFQNTTQLKDEFRSITAILSLAQVRLFMDSFAQHAAAAMNLPSTVLWVANKPQVFGYNLHHNIVANPFTVSPDLRSSYIGEFDISGNPLEFPYNNEDEIFNTDAVIASLKSQLPVMQPQQQQQEAQPQAEPQAAIEEVK
jgi:hypothetical protein